MPREVWVGAREDVDKRCNRIQVAGLAKKIPFGHQGTHLII